MSRACVCSRTGQFVDCALLLGNLDQAREHLDTVEPQSLVGELSS